MITSLPSIEHDAACHDQPVYLYLAEALPPGPLMLKVGQSRDPRARQSAGLILPETPHSRLLVLIRVPDRRAALCEERDLHMTMWRDHPHLCLAQAGRYGIAALEVLCGLLDAIARFDDQDG